MEINFYAEIDELSPRLKSADGYLDCENVMISHIKKHLNNKLPIPDIESYLKKLLAYCEDKMVVNRGNPAEVNYKYAAGFLNTVLDTPFWYNWIKVVI